MFYGTATLRSAHFTRHLTCAQVENGSISDPWLCLVVSGQVMVKRLLHRPSLLLASSRTGNVYHTLVFELVSSLRLTGAITEMF